MLARGVLVVGVMVGLPARAQGVAPEPWKVGVSENHMAEAKVVLDEATGLFVERHYPEALDRFRQALALWDHPAIRFDIVRCLIQLDRPLEAADNLERALAFGKAALPGTTYEQALEFQKLLANEIGEVAIRCREPDVAVTIDGHALGRCPLESTTRVIPGPHQIVGTKRGYLTETRTATVFGGKRIVLTIAPVPLANAGVEVRRWPVAVPWLVLGGGAIVAGAGGLVRLQASHDMATYDSAIRKDCRTTGCTPASVDGGLRLRAVHENEAAIAVASVGAAALITGGILLYANRAQTIYPALEAAPAGATLGVRGAF